MPVGNRHRTAQTEQLGLTGRETGRGLSRANQIRRDRTPEIPEAPPEGIPRRPALDSASWCVAEPDPGAEVRLRGQAVGPETEHRFGVRVVRRRPPEARPLQPGAQRQLHAARRPPDVPHVHRLVHAGRGTHRRRQCAREDRGSVGLEVGKRLVGEGPEPVAGHVQRVVGFLVQDAQLETMPSHAGKPGDFVADLQRIRGGLPGRTWVATELIGGHPEAASLDLTGHLHPPLRQGVERGALLLGGIHVGAKFVQHLEAEARAHGQLHAAGRRAVRPGHLGKCQATRAGRVLPVVAPIAAEREGMALAHGPVETQQAGKVVAGPGIQQRGGNGRTGESGQLDEPRRGIGVGAKDVEGGRGGVQQGLERVVSDPRLARAEDEEPVAEDRRPGTTGDLVLRVPSGEGIAPVIADGEFLVTQSPGETALGQVVATAAAHRHLPAAELAPGHVVAVGDDPGGTEPFRGHRGAAKRGAIERDGIRLGTLPRHREPGGGRIGGGHAHDPGRQQRQEVQV